MKSGKPDKVVSAALRRSVAASGRSDIPAPKPSKPRTSAQGNRGTFSMFTRNRYGK